MREGIRLCLRTATKETVGTGHRAGCCFASGSNAAFTFIWPVETAILRPQGLNPLFFNVIWC
jgi:hypothetical protein